jgi:hypothetical protein
MSLSPEHEEYLKKHHMKRLTFNGVDDLYQHFIWGAYTIAQCIEKDRISVEYYKKLKEEFVATGSIFAGDCSEELSIRNERCIDENGMGLF